MKNEESTRDEENDVPEMSLAAASFVLLFKLFKFEAEFRIIDGRKHHDSNSEKQERGGRGTRLTFCRVRMTSP